ncbi:MAG: UvrD-helicase domain-containing protein [Phycisphaerae bacterium]|nr:UvrD-helicase domain-containing protein [Phycisphaerae bacterium]
MMSDLLADLNAPQREAVTYIDGPLLVLAGAGSGKTRVITRRVAYLVQRGVEPYHVLAITFTNKAAEEMRRRVIDLRTPRGATICTFHSLCARLLRQFADRRGLSGNYTIYDRDDQLKVVKAAINELNLAGAYLTPARVHARISNAKNDLKSADAFAGQAGEFFDRQVAEVYKKYEQLLRRNNALDFDDLLLHMACLLRDHPDVRRRLGERYRYVLIDEYQDTNRAQYLIAHAIALDHENLCATGDPDQSIYAWRGADINNILGFEQDYPNARVIRLEENYRSVQPILTAASRLIQHNTMRKRKALFTHRPGDRKVRVVYVNDEHAEARQVARRIEDHRIAGGAYSDVAVFYRVNSISRVIEEGLRHVGVPYRVARGVEFYNRKEIKDVLAYLKLLANPADDLSCARIINTPARGIGATTVNKLSLFAADRRIGLLEAARRVEEVNLGAATRKKVKAFADVMTELEKDLSRPVGEILEEVLRRTGLEEMFDRKDEETQQARANVDELISDAAEFDEEEHEHPLAEYLQQVSLVSDADHFAGDQGAVTLMTLHAAKGLEFPMVFIVGCEENVLPWQRGARKFGESEDLFQLEEERRLAFVGMTRAKDHLTLLSARSRRVRGVQEAQTASRFLTEIGAEAVEVDDLATLAPEGLRRPKQRGGFYAETHERSAIETFAQREDAAVQRALKADDALSSFSDDDQMPFPPEYEHLRPGCMVHHPKFGVGKLVKLSRSWPETRADVLFHDAGQKRLVLRLTHLEMME